MVCAQASGPQAAKQATTTKLASTTLARQEVEPSLMASPGLLAGGVLAMLGASVAVNKVMGGSSGEAAKLQAQIMEQTNQLQQQLQAQQAQLQAQLQAQQAQQLTAALEGFSKEMDRDSVISRAVGLSLEQRAKAVRMHFPTALPVDDFMNRVEVALAAKGFTGDNTIAMSNLCRDESCLILEDKIESVFGACFSTHGLGGVLTCGVIGIKAGLSHSPVGDNGKEQYVFFSFPHIAIDSLAKIGAINRPNRPGLSAACGALCACLNDFKKDGLEANCKVPGVHDPLEPEYSILKQRLARLLKKENCNVADLDLVSITKAAERTITNDLLFLIEKAVDPTKANYAVFTGTQIHNWSSDLNNRSIPSLEFVSVGESFTVINGVKQKIDLASVPALSPRQMSLLGAVVEEQHPDVVQHNTPSTIQEIPRGYLMRRVGGAAGTRYVDVPMTKTAAK